MNLWIFLQTKFLETLLNRKLDSVFVFKHKTEPLKAPAWGFEALSENQKLGLDSKKLGQVFKKLDCVFVITKPILSQSAMVKLAWCEWIWKSAPYLWLENRYNLRGTPVTLKQTQQRIWKLSLFHFLPYENKRT